MATEWKVMSDSERIEHLAESIRAIGHSKLEVTCAAAQFQELHDKIHDLEARVTALEGRLNKNAFVRFLTRR